MTTCKKFLRKETKLISLFNVTVQENIRYYSLTWKADGQGCFVSDVPSSGCRI